MIRKGSRVGSITWNQRVRPSLAPEKTAFGKYNNKTNIISTEQALIYRFIGKTPIISSI
jgi:hypothetical protein